MAKKEITIDQAMAMAENYARNGQHDSARKLYVQILQVDPGNAGVQKALAGLPAGAGESAFSRDMRQLMGLLSDGQLQQVDEQATRVAAAHPGQPMPLNLQGAARLGMGRPERAVEPLRAAVEVAPEYPDAWNNLGNAYLILQQLDDAEQAYRQALALDQAPGIQAAANTGLGKVLAAQGELIRARTCFEAALSHDPSDSVVRVALAMTIREEGDAAAAAKRLQQLLRQEPNNVTAQLELAICLRQMLQTDEAIEAIERALELDSDSVRAHLLLGQYQAARGEYQEAARAYRRGLELEPGSARVQHLLDAVEGRRTPKADAGYMADYFDSFAGNFENQLVNSLEYSAPQTLAGLIREQLGERAGPGSAIDLGCGTGLMGEQIAGLAQRLVGVDLSRRMLDRAREKNIYDELSLGDIVDLLGQAPRAYDLVVSADVLIYLGELEPLMQAVAAGAREGALLAFSTELLPEGDYKLLPTGRYAQSRDYVCASAEASGLELLRFESGPLRKEGGSWIEGGYYLFHKPLA